MAQFSLIVIQLGTVFINAGIFMKAWSCVALYFPQLPQALDYWTCFWICCAFTFCFQRMNLSFKYKGDLLDAEEEEEEEDW